MCLGSRVMVIVSFSEDEAFRLDEFFWGLWCERYLTYFWMKDLGFVVYVREDFVVFRCRDGWVGFL